MRPMERSTREVEVKLPFESPAAARKGIERLSARLVRPRHFEDNLVLDREADPLLESGVLLRVRRAGEESILTLKLPVRGVHRHKVREEQETQVADGGALLEILHHLGFRTRYRYQKYRTVFALGELAVCLDETPIGCYVELEGRPEEIDRAAAQLGFEPAQYVCENYRDLHERAVRERRVAPGDMLVEVTEGSS